MTYISMDRWNHFADFCAARGLPCGDKGREAIESWAQYWAWLKEQADAEAAEKSIGKTGSL